MTLVAALEALRSPGSRPGHEIAVWWRLCYGAGAYLTEAGEQSSICFARAGAHSLQLVARPDAEPGMGVMEVPLAPGERPIFYRIRAFDLGQPDSGSACQAIVYGRAFERGDQYDVQLWCIEPGKPGLERPVRPEWVDRQMIELQATEYGR